MKYQLKFSGLILCFFILCLTQSCKKDPATVDPALISISENSVTQNDEVKVTGQGFSTTLTDDVLKLDNQAVEILSASSTQITIKIPANITIGAKKLTLAVAHVDAKNPLDVKVYGWKKVADHPRGAFYEIASFSIANNIYFCDGRAVDDSYIKETWKYSLTDNTWTRVADFPGPMTHRYSMVCFAIGSKGYLGMGDDDYPATSKDFWEYDPDLNKWTQKADFIGDHLIGQCSFVLNGKGYVGTGFSITSSAVVNDFYCYTPGTNTWQKIAELPGDKILGATTFVLSGKAYLTGGETLTASVKKLWQYDDGANSWAPKTDFPGEYTANMASFALNTTAYCGLGATTNNESGTETMWSYNPTENTWKSIAAFPGTKRKSYVDGTVGQYAYYGLGSESVNFSDLWIYAPKDYIP
jgi:hypothetical protein